MALGVVDRMGCDVFLPALLCVRRHSLLGVWPSLMVIRGQLNAILQSIVPRLCNGD